MVTGAQLLAAAALVAVVLALLPGWIRPSIVRSRIRTAPVTTGAMDASFTASGVVTPAIERVVSSPLDARVLRILRRPGAAVHPGDAILELDVSDAVVALQQTESDLQFKDNQQAQTRLGYERSLVDLDGRLAIKTLQLETRQAELAMHRQLAGRGLLSTEQLRQSELAVRQAEIERGQLQLERANAGKATEVQLEGLSLERAALGRAVIEKRRVLDLATTKADRDAVVTWVVAEEGAAVRRGDVIARLADLRSFRVDATASDIHSTRIRPGLVVQVRVDGTALDGVIAEVYPKVEEGSVRFLVSLDDSANPVLRPSLRAEVQVITERRPRTLKVKRGPFADGTGARQVFVIRGDRAVRTDVELGVSSFDDVEILSGLTEGDEVVISDMRDFLHLEQMRVR
jgi:HlyD family secretion protein